MTIGDLARDLGLTNLTPELETAGSAEITGGYASDLLSDVLANAPSGGVLVTVQVHLNVIAVALHAELAAVIFAHGRTPEEALRIKAAEEGVALFVSKEPAFDVVGKLYARGVRGTSGK
jgi:hypothetical protein